MGICNLAVAAGTDDASVYWNGSAWVIGLTGTYSRIGRYDATNLKSGQGLRWISVPIGKGEPIITAKIGFYCNSSNSNTVVRCRITGDLEADAATFSSIANYQGRRGTDVGGANNNLRTISQVVWNPMAAWSSSNWYWSPEIRSIIQEIVNQATWAKNNALALFVDDHLAEGDDEDGHVRSYKTWNAATEGENSPVLHIEYGGQSTQNKLFALGLV